MTNLLNVKYELKDENIFWEKIKKLNKVLIFYKCLWRFVFSKKKQWN